jgi:hypothetical protein
MSRCIQIAFAILFLAMAFANAILLLEMKVQVDALTKKVYQLEFSHIGK